MARNTTMNVRDFLLKEAQKASEKPMERSTPSPSVSADLNDLECSIDEKTSKGCVKFYCRPCRCHLYSSAIAVDHLCSKDHLLGKGKKGRNHIAKRSLVKGLEKAKRAVKENGKVFSKDEEIMIDAIWTKSNLTAVESEILTDGLKWISGRVLPATECRFCSRKQNSEVERKIHEFTIHTLEAAALEKFSE